jgi:long-chain acyl-CoA synthetase
MSAEKPWLASYAPGVPAEINADEFSSLPAVFAKSCALYRDRPAFSNMGKVLTYAELDKLSTQFASFLRNTLKLQKGDRIALMMPNLLQYPIAIFGALRAGLTIVNTNPMYTARELKHQLNDAGVSAIVVLENFAATVSEVLPETGCKHVSTSIKWCLHLISHTPFHSIQRSPQVHARRCRK